MKTSRVMVLLLATLAIICVCDYYVENDSNVTNSFELLGDAGTIQDNALSDNVVLNNKNNEYVQKYTFVNNRSYTISLSQENIDIVCTGKGANKEKDERLVKENMKIDATFSLNENSSRTSSINVAGKDTAIVYITSSYKGNTLPEEEVNCDYNVRLEAA